MWARLVVLPLVVALLCAVGVHFPGGELERLIFVEARVAFWAGRSWPRASW
jgi:hypothetical protein